MSFDNIGILKSDVTQVKAQNIIEENISGIFLTMLKHFE